jgi:hypothetical protein
MKTETQFTIVESENNDKKSIVESENNDKKYQVSKQCKSKANMLSTALVNKSTPRDHRGGILLTEMPTKIMALLYKYS